MTRVHLIKGNLATQDTDVIVNPFGGTVTSHLLTQGGAALAAEIRHCLSKGFLPGAIVPTSAPGIAASTILHVSLPEKGPHNNHRHLHRTYAATFEEARGLGARSISFPLLGAGAADVGLVSAVRGAALALSDPPPGIEEVRLVIPNHDFSKVDSALMSALPILLIRGIRRLHERGHHGVHAVPSIAPSGMFWRLEVIPSKEFRDDFSQNEAVYYTSGSGRSIGGLNLSAIPTMDEVANALIQAAPALTEAPADEDYVRWFEIFLRQIEFLAAIPVAIRDYGPDPLLEWSLVTTDGSHFPIPAPPGFSVAPVH